MVIFNKKIIFKDEGKILILIVILFTLLRLYIGQYEPIWFVLNTIHDDVLLISYSDIFTHFTSWNILSLAKTMTYPLFLYFVNITGLPYRLWLSLLWIFGGLILTYGANKYITSNKIFLLFSYLFIIFLPIAFDSWGGTRIYRNSILAPFAILFLSTLFVFINKSIFEDEKNKSIIFWGILLGLLFTLNYYIKEDGIMNIPIFLISILFILIYKIINVIKIKKNHKYKDITKIIIICLIPLLIFGVSTIAYKEVNNHYFGVSEINTRTEGELGEFWKNLLKIEDENKSTRYWVPASTIIKAWEASPTLKSQPNLLNNILHSPWAGGDLIKNPIPGDHVAWSLRDALLASNLFNNEKQTNDFFKDVNNELDEAFANGSLKVSDKIFITSSANGKKFDEIKGMKLYIMEAIKTSIFYNNVSILDFPIKGTSQHIVNNNTTNTEDILNDDLLSENEVKNDFFTEKFPLILMKSDLTIYKIISYLIVLFSAIGFIISITYQIKNKFKDIHLNIFLGFELLLLGTYLVEIFAISWFTSWLDIIYLFYYIVPCYGIIAIFEVLTIGNLIYILNTKNFNLKNLKKTKNGIKRN